MVLFYIMSCGRFHSESSGQVLEEEEQDYSNEVDRMDEMLEDLQPEFTKNPPTTKVEMFFELLKALEEPLHIHIEVTLLS
jgi:hypothetical protein